MEELKYCMCCGEQVPCSVIIRHGRRELNCVFCGFTLDISDIDEPAPVAVVQPVALAAPAAETPAAGLVSEPPAPVAPASGEGYALVADDSRFTRKIIEALLKETKYSAQVMAFENGLELLTAFSKLLAEKRLIDLCIIDLNMPVMDGLTAARMIRALEARSHTPGVPIVFFSAEKCDQGLKQQMENMEPANYVNKGTDPDPDKLAQRIEFLLTYLHEKYKEQPA